MADMPSDFWSGWIVVLTIAGTIGLGWLIVGVYFSGDDHDDETTPVWDETLTEGSNPAPMWWFWMIFVSLIFSVVYLMLYPGLGSYQGTLQWSQGGEYEEKADRFEAAFADERARLSAMSLQDLQQHPKAMASARRIFDRTSSSSCLRDAGFSGRALRVILARLSGMMTETRPGRVPLLSSRCCSSGTSS